MIDVPRSVSSSNLKKSPKTSGLVHKIKSQNSDDLLDGEEIIDDIDDVDTLRSEDLGLNNHKISQSKVSNEGLPSLYNSKNLSTMSSWAAPERI